jgi:Family of unknown function (DUF6084)
MTALTFSVLDIAADRFAATPQLLARMRVEETTGERVHTMAVRSQIVIEPQRRPYTEDESAGMLDQFGDRPRWKDTLKPFLWTFSTALVSGFSGATEFDLPIPCSYDLEVTASKYLHALDVSDIPIRMLFSGSVFSRGSTGFAVEPIAWDLEATYLLPVSVWTELIAHFYPSSGWLRLDHDTIAALVRYKGEHGLVTWDEVVARLLAAGVVDGLDPAGGVSAR